MKLTGKTLRNTRRKRRDRVVADKQNAYINSDVHDGNLAQDTSQKQEGAEEEPCTTLPSAEGLENPETALVATSQELTPTQESAVQIIRDKRKKFSGKHLPIVHCNSCRFTQTCPMHKPGYECGYVNSMIKQIEGVEDIPEFMKLLVEAEMGRAQQALIFEQLAGGDLTESVQIALDGVFSKMQTLYTLNQDAPADTGDRGLIRQLFGDLIEKAQPVSTIDTEDVSDAETIEE